MVTFPPASRRERAFLATEMVVALGILVVVALPLAYAHVDALRRVAADYRRTALLELIDGEAEILAAGAARSIAEGRHEWTFHGASARNLPAGHLTLTREGNRARLEWIPTDRRQGRPVLREFTLRNPSGLRAQP